MNKKRVSVNGKPAAPEADKLPPHEPEAERGVLGCMLLDEQVIGDVEQKLPDSEAFYLLPHQVLYSTIRAMHAENLPVDVSTVGIRLRAQGELEAVGGLLWLNALVDGVPSALNWPYYAQSVENHWLRRRIVKEVTAGAWMALDDNLGDPRAALAALEARLMDLGGKEEALGIYPASALVQEVMERVEVAYKQRAKGIMTGVLSGFSYFDKMCSGLQRGELAVIAARPSMGKTSWLCSAALNMAVRGGQKVGFISVESGRHEIMLRMLCAHSRANLKQVHSGCISEKDLEKLTEGCATLSGSGLWIMDAPGLTPAQLRSGARLLVKRHGCTVILLDHLHEMHVPEARGDERIAATEAATAAKFVARTFHVPVIAAAQLNREFGREGKTGEGKGRRPRMTDLRSSGVLEQKADLIGILCLDTMRVAENQSIHDLTSWDVILEIVKQRNGPTGDCRFTFLRESLLYLDRYLGAGSEEGGQKRWEKLAGGA